LRIPGIAIVHLNQTSSHFAGCNHPADLRHSSTERTPKLKIIENNNKLKYVNKTGGGIFVRYVKARKILNVLLNMTQI